VSINPDWLFHPGVKGDELWEDVYERLWKSPPTPPKPPPGRKPGDQPGQGASQTPSQGQESSKVEHTPKTAGDAGKTIKGRKGDPVAQAQAGSFDQVLEPMLDDNGAEDLPDAQEFREAIAEAASAAKMMGKLPANLKKLVDEVLEPQVDWKEHLRMLMAGKVGWRGETWNRPNRRRLALNPIVIMPSKKPYGCETIAVAFDTSGSIYADRKALAQFFGELASIISDIRPKRVIVIECDATIQKVHDVSTMEEVELIREKGVTGGGGTSFVPVFNWIEKEGVYPEQLVFLTDLWGTFPDEKPAYPVIWAAISDGEVPWGDVVRVRMKE
jgi:predicted metal-dependent peptidase